MGEVKIVRMLYGREGMELRVPAAAHVLRGHDVGAIENAEQAVIEAMNCPIGSPSLRQLLDSKKPRSVAITISDITRPVPNREFLPAMLEVLNEAGIGDRQIVIIVGAGMHRPSSREECEFLVGPEILQRIEIVNHRADDAQTVVKACDDPPVRICRRFAEADFRIVTGYIEPHFMAGFSGGRKGVCPALVDLQTIQRFHGFETLANQLADNGVLKGNPCHEIALKAARAVGVDFLFNVAITRDRRIAGIYCGDLEKAHIAGCEQVAKWTCAEIDGPFDIVITNGGGYPLDQTFYQTVKGMCGVLPALDRDSTLLMVSHCGEQLGSKEYTDMMLSYDNDWRRFLADIEADCDTTRLDQWEFQMQARVLDRIGREKLWFVSDGIGEEIQRRISVAPILGPEPAQQRAQQAIDEYLSSHGDARIAIIPEGPYTMLRRQN